MVPPSSSDVACRYLRAIVAAILKAEDQERSFTPEEWYAAALWTHAYGQISPEKGSEHPLRPVKYTAQGRSRNAYHQILKLLDRYGKGDEISSRAKKLDEELRPKAEEKASKLREKARKMESAIKAMPDIFDEGDLREIEEKVEKLEKTPREALRDDSDYKQRIEELETDERSHKEAKQAIDGLKSFAERDLKKLQESAGRRRSDFSKKVVELAGQEKISEGDGRAFVYAPHMVHGDQYAVPPLKSEEEEQAAAEAEQKEKESGKIRRLWLSFLDEETRNPLFGQPGHTKERVKRHTLYNQGGTSRQQVMREWGSLKKRKWWRADPSEHLG